MIPISMYDLQKGDVGRQMLLRWHQSGSVQLTKASPLITAGKSYLEISLFKLVHNVVLNL